MKVKVYHSYYGCDTGCCGHVVEVGDKEKFEFTHPYDEVVADFNKWALEFAQATVKREWPQCYDKIDWSTLQVEDISDGSKC